MSDLTCEERIDEYLATVAGEIKEMYKADVENGNGYDPHHALHVDVVVDENGKPEYGQYLMSWGGPSDELRFYYNGKIEYVFMDWFDGAERKCTEKKHSVIFDIAENYLGLTFVKNYSKRNLY